MDVGKKYLKFDYIIPRFGLFYCRTKKRRTSVMYPGDKAIKLDESTSLMVSLFSALNNSDLVISLLLAIAILFSEVFLFFGGSEKQNIVGTASSVRGLFLFLPSNSA